MSNIDLNNLPKEKFVLVNENKKLHDKELVTKPVGFFKDAMHRFAKNKGSIVAAIVIGILILFSIIAPIISPYTVSYSDDRYKYRLPKLFNSEKIDFLDGAKNVDTNFVTFIEHYSKGVETGYNAIKRQSYTYNPKTDKYHYRLDTYNAVGTVFMSSMSRSEYYAIQNYQDKSGIQIIYPITDVNKRPKNQKNVDNANIWYETEPDKNQSEDDSESSEVKSTNDVPVNYTKNEDGSFTLTNIYKEYSTPVLSATSAFTNSARVKIENKDGGYAIKVLVKEGAKFGGEDLKEDQVLGYLSIQVENGTKNGTFFVDTLDKAQKFEYDNAYHTFKTTIGGHTNPEDDGVYFFGLPFEQGSSVTLLKETELKDLTNLSQDELKTSYVPMSLYEDNNIVDNFELNKEYLFAINRDRPQTNKFFVGDVLAGDLRVVSSKPVSFKFEETDGGYRIKTTSGKFSNYLKVSIQNDKCVFEKIATSDKEQSSVWTYDNTTGYLKTYLGGHSDSTLDKEYILGFDSDVAEAKDMIAKMCVKEDFNDKVFPLLLATSTSFDLV